VFDAFELRLGILDLFAEAHATHRRSVSVEAARLGRGKKPRGKTNRWLPRHVPDEETPLRFWIDGLRARLPTITLSKRDSKAARRKKIDAELRAGRRASTWVVTERALERRLEADRYARACAARVAARFA